MRRAKLDCMVRWDGLGVPCKCGTYPITTPVNVWLASFNCTDTMGTRTERDQFWRDLLQASQTLRNGVSYSTKISHCPLPKS
jgi:hypothetical protein